MQSAHLVENSESQDRSESHGDKVTPTSTNSTNDQQNSSGLYDADKCRAHIANQIKVSKIDRFAAQVSKAVEVETSFQSRLGNIMNMFIRRSAQVTHDFTLKCKLGLQRHRQDRILNNQRKKPSKLKTESVNRHDSRFSTISNDLLYGPGAQLVHTLLTKSLSPTKHSKRKFDEMDQDEICNNFNGLVQDQGDQNRLSEDDYLLSDLFEPSLFVAELEDSIRENILRSRAINSQLNSIKLSFERLAMEHRDKVDLVYAAEEERQAASVTRRSAYNLSMAAIKATSTPIHVNYNNEIS